MASDMAGFFLYKTNETELDIDEVKVSFKKKGLDSPQQYILGNYTLLLYKKMISSCPNIIENMNGFCCSVGTYIYQGKDYTESLYQSLEDYKNNALCLEEMYGQFTLILYSDNRITLVSDALYTKHIFTDIQKRFFTSSLFAAIDSLSAVTYNRNAILEKMLTGIIATPDTLVNEIIQIGRNEQERINKEQNDISFLIHKRKELLQPHNKGKAFSVKEQAYTISNYFKRLSPALSCGCVDMGLSAGHDSTLVFAAAYPYLKGKLHLHTHSTGHVHDREKNAAQKIANTKGIEINIIPTPRLDENGIDLKSLLDENIEFFDGRTSHDIGGFSATYRADYRIRATDKCRTSITGVGGECLRNHYSVVGKKIKSSYFFDEIVFNQSFKESVSTELYTKTKEYHLGKAEKILNVNLHGKVDRVQLRRYYSEVLMPDGQGNVIDAYNLVSNCFSPFLDEHIVREAYRGIHYLGNCGEYESAIIVALDNEIGECINSNNGYPFDCIPISLRIKEAIRARISAKTWNKLSELKGKKTSSNYFMSVLSKSSELEKGYDDLKMDFPDVDFSKLLNGYAMDANIEYLAMALWRVKNGR